MLLWYHGGYFGQFAPSVCIPYAVFLRCGMRTIELGLIPYPLWCGYLSWAATDSDKYWWHATPGTRCMTHSVRRASHHPV